MLRFECSKDFALAFFMVIGAARGPRSGRMRLKLWQILEAFRFQAPGATCQEFSTMSFFSTEVSGFRSSTAETSLQDCVERHVKGLGLGSEGQ